MSAWTAAYYDDISLIGNAGLAGRFGDIFVFAG
jgi:hypothetical protein